MHWWSWLLLAVGAVATVVVVAALAVRRSRSALVELVRLVPACLALLRDVMGDPSVPRRTKVAPALAILHLVNPIDLILDFIPGLGHLDDALIVTWAIRHLIAGAGSERVTAHWKGDTATLERILRLAGPASTSTP